MTTKQLVYTALMTAIIAILGLVPVIPLPFTKAISISLAYLPGDILKAIVASLIGTALLNHSQFRQIMGIK